MLLAGQEEPILVVTNEELTLSVLAPRGHRKGEKRMRISQVSPLWK